MLAQMTAAQYYELQLFFRVEEEAREELHSEAADIQIAEFLRKKMRQQRKQGA